MGMIGNQPANNFLAVTKDTFNGNASSYTLSKAATTNGVAVFVENVRQIPTTAYSVSGTTLTFTGTTPAGTGNVYVLHHNSPASTATHPAAQALTATSGTFTGAFTSLGIDDNADATAITIDSSEKVGIGTTTPSQLLNLQASTNPVIQVSTLADDNPTDAGALDIVEKQSSASSTATFGQNGVYGFRVGLNGSDNTLRIKSGSQTTVNDRVTLARDTGDLTLSTGNLIVGTSGKGIDFSATGTSGQGSMTSELLDVYEEGTFTPAAGDYSGTMTFTTAYYTKIGRVVNFSFKMTGDGTSDSSQVNITGFPYAVLQEHPVSLSYDVAGNGALQSNTTPTIPNAMVNTAEICYFYIPTGSAFTYSMIATGYVRVSGTYMTSN